VTHTCECRRVHGLRRLQAIPPDTLLGPAPQHIPRTLMSSACVCACLSLSLCVHVRVCGRGVCPRAAPRVGEREASSAGLRYSGMRGRKGVHTDATARVRCG
jgi:hypothetical protein